MPKNAQTTAQIALISHASKAMVKILQARLQQYVNFQMFKLVLKKAEEPEMTLKDLLDYRKSKRVPEKHLFLLDWLCESLWLCGSKQTVENPERDGIIRPWEICMQVKKKQLELDMEQQTGSK